MADPLYVNAFQNSCIRYELQRWNDLFQFAREGDMNLEM